MTETGTQDIPTTYRDEVAALIGVGAGTLPKGPCTVEKATLRSEYVNLYKEIVPWQTDATAYVWRDAQNNKIAEVKVPTEKDASLRYQVITYDAAGGIDRREDVKNGTTLSNVIRYYDNGQVSTARYGMSYGYDDQAERILKFDRAGKLHSLSGYADRVISEADTFNGHYYIHGQEYSENEYRRNPEYIADHSIGKTFGRLAGKVSGLFAPHAQRKASWPSAVTAPPSPRI